MNNPTDQSANIYKKQVINNPFSNQLRNFYGSTSAENLYPSWDNHQGQPMNTQQQLFNSHGQPVNLQQPLFTYVPIPTAALRPLVSRAASLQNYHQFLAETSLHNNSTFIQQQEQFGQNQRTPNKRSFNNRNNDWNEEKYHRQESPFNNTNGTDLRTKLIRRRRRSCGASFDNNHGDFKHEKTTTRETKKKIEPQSTPAIQAKPLTLAPLKTLTATNSESNQWFIVVEKDIILENYTFLDDLVTADPDCQLVVPHHVMSELRMHVSISSDVRPRRTLRFLTQQIENGMAMLGEQEEGYNSSRNTILTCVKLATRNNVAILITNNKETLRFKANRKGIHIFTMRDVKDILANKSPKPRTSSPTMAIKIVVPNNFNNEKDTRDPENNITRELFKHYNQSNSNNDKPDTPPPLATKNGIKVKRIIDKRPKAPKPPFLAIMSPEPETNKISPEVSRRTPEKISLNRSKINYKNSKPAMANISSNFQQISTQITPDKNTPSTSKIYGNNLHKQASDVVAPLISPTQPTKAVPCNINAVNVEDVSEGARNELCGRGSATFIAPTDRNKANFHHTSEINNPVSDSNAVPKYSPTKPEFASPRKVYNSNWNHTRNKNMHDKIDTSPTSSTSNISLDSISIKKIISMKKLTTSTSKRQIDNVKEMTPPIIGSKSPSTCGSYDITSEPNLEKTTNKNLAMEENSTSTSGVISNSESLNSDKVINPRIQDVKKNSRRRLVMYEVVCQSMEEVLRLRSEEWVFRFVQIMEEVLRVKLQEKIPNEHKEPAPWNLIEAAKCIIKKFYSHFDVINAASNLARFLSETSDQSGKIINIEPSDYMELYSYGVFLVETLLDMCTDCKEGCRTKENEKRGRFSGEKCSCHEVETASELLKKLLFDIHNANVETLADEEVDHPPDFFMDSSVDDSTHYDFNMKTRKQSFTEVDKMKMNEIDNAKKVKIIPIKRRQSDRLLEVTLKAKNPKASLNGPQSTKNVYKAAEADEVPSKVQTTVKAGKMSEKYFFNCLQLSKKVDENKKSNGLSKEADVKVPPKVTNITMGTTSDSAFISSFRLDKEDLNNVDKLKACKITVICSNTPAASDEQKDPTRSSPKEFLGLKCHFGKEDNLLEKPQPKVVCTFKINEDIERRVNAKRYQKEYEHSEPEENIIGESNETQDNIRSVDNNLGTAANETVKRIPVDDNLNERTTDGNHLPIEKNVHKNDNINEDAANDKFQHHIKKLCLNVTKMLFTVTSLCNTYFEKNEEYCKLSCAIVLLERVQKALESAKKREPYKDNFENLLRLENSEDYLNDDRFSLQYRRYIAKCARRTEKILKDVRGVINQIESEGLQE